MPTTGELYFGTDGNAADFRFFVGDAGSTPVPVATPGSRFADIAIDPATGFFFAIINNGAAGQNAFLVRGLLSNPASVTVVADYRNVVGDANDDSIVNALFLDAANRRIYVGVQDANGSTATTSGIHQYTYSQAGAVTDNGFLVTSATSAKPLESGFTVFDPFDFAYDSGNNTLLFTETVFGAPSTGLFRLNLSSPNTITQVVNQAQFPDSTTNNWFVDVDVDVSTHLAYFTTQGPTTSPTGGYSSTLNGIWYVLDTATNATATQLPLLNANSTNFYSTHPNFFPGQMTFDQNARQIYVASEELDPGADDTIYVFQLNAAGTSATLVTQFTPSNSNTSGNIWGLGFNALPSLTATVNAAAATEQGSLVALTTAQTVGDPGGGYLTGATIQITGGTFNSNENSFNDDHLTLGIIGSTSGTLGAINWNYTQATGLLTLSGYDTIANYQTAIAAARYYATGDNPTNYGANTTRTLTVILNDGSLNVPVASTNTSTLTRSITAVNDAPTSTGLQGDSVTTTEPAGAGSVLPNVKIDSGGNATIADVDNLNFNNGSISFAITSGLVSSQDQLVIDTAAATTVTVAGGVVSVGGTAIGTVAGGTGGLPLVVTFNNLGNATPARVQTLIRAIDFANTGGDSPTAGGRTITTTLGDGSGGADTITITSSVTVVAVDDASVAVADPTNPVLENATVAIAVLSNDTDPDTTLDVNRIVLINGTGVTIGAPVTLASGAIATLNANGTITYNPNGKFNTLIDAVTAAATGAVNTSATDSFTYTLAGGSQTTVTVQVNGVQSSDDRLGGNSGANTITGTAAGDYFDLSQGGNDTANGQGGDDAFYFGAALTALDSVNGGAGANDQVGLEGNYSGGLILGAATITNVEVLAVLPGFSYNITSNDGNVAAGQTLSVFGGNLAAGQNLTFNGSAETDGSFRMFGGLGNDTFTGGAGDDGFYFGPGKWGAGDTVVGGGGPNDQLALDGNYTVTIGATADVETLILLPQPSGPANTYNITLSDAWIVGAATKAVWGLNVTTSMTINGSAETAGSFRFFGGQAGDTLTGGAGNDFIFGGGGGDTLRGNAGIDTFFYDSAAQSTSTGYDTLIDFNYTTDLIQISGQTHDTYSLVGSGTLSTATFDADLGTALNAQLTVGNAVFFTPNAGTLAGSTFLVVDANGLAGYQAGQDYVFLMPSPPPPLPPTDFLIA
jgi:VCBS repeat-containing protein